MKTISHNKVMEFKSEAINKQPLRVKGSMSELDLVGYDQVELKGMGLKMIKGKLGTKIVGSSKIKKNRTQREVGGMGR